MRPEAIFRSLPTLETERLILRSLRLNDAADMFAYAADPFVARYTTWRPHKDIDYSRRFLQRIQQSYEGGEVAPWGVVHREENRMIGTCGFVDWHGRHRRAEVGYALGQAYWGQGLATEALEEVLRFGFRTMHANRIQALCLPENIASARVMEKVGMSYEGLLRQYAVIKQKPVDLKVYAIVRQTYFSGHPQ